MSTRIGIIKVALQKLEKYDLIMNRKELALLDGVIDLLDVFNVFTTFMQGNQYPTINTFVLFHTEIEHRLKDVIAFSEDDVIQRAAEILQANLIKRMPLTIEFIGAAIIDPNMQRLPAIERWLYDNGKGLRILYVVLFIVVY